MQSIADRSRCRRAALVVTGAAAALAMSAPSASAFFVVPRCGGSTIQGSGATFAGNAFDAYFQNFSTTAAGCPSHPLIAYTRSGSGRGRGVMGGSTTPGGDANGTPGVRVNDFRFGASEEGPSVASQNNMNNGDLTTTADDGKVRVIPVAAGAVVPTVNYPNKANAAQCPIPTAFTLTRETRDRLAVPNALLEKAWAGQFATWGDFLPGLTALDAECGAKKLVRVVRQDNSGTTFAWKDYLDAAAALPGASATDWKPGLTSSSLLNRSWPNTRPGSTTGGATVSDANALGFQTPALDTECRAAIELAGTSNYIAGTGAFTGAGNPVCRSGPDANAPSNGNNPQARLLKRTDGSIGYTELAVVVEESLRISPTNTDKYAMAMAVQGAGNPATNAASYVEPSKNANGFVEGNPTGGANCDTVPVNNVPGGLDPTATPAGAWNPVTMALPNAGFSACSLTYALAFDDDAPVYLAIAGNTYDAEERKARALKDLLTYAVSDAGQATLTANDYSPLGGAALLAARDGVARIDWDKANTGRPPATTPPPPPPPPPAPIAPPPPPGPGSAPIVSNTFTISSARAKASDILLSLNLAGAGSVSVKSSATFRRAGRTRKIANAGSTTVTVSKSGVLSVKFRLSPAARSALRTAKRLSMKITVVYTPRGGSAATKSRTLVLKAKAKAKA